MAIFGISTFETEKYVSVKDPHKTLEEGATIFELGSLDADIKSRILDAGVSMVQTPQGTKIMPNQNGTWLEAVRYGLRGWQNFKDDKGKDIPFASEKVFVNGKEYMVADLKTLNALPSWLLKELGDHILSVNSVGEGVGEKSKTE